MSNRITEQSAVFGVDVGGTYTDVVAAFGDHVLTLKVPSRPSAPHESVLQGLELLQQQGAPAGELVHGTTVATNAVITRRGARVALFTTRGFRDVLEMRRRERPETYGLDGTFTPLVERELRLEVAERVLSDGSVETPVDLAQVDALIDGLPADVEAIAVALINSHVNPVHERAIASRLADRGFRYVSLSHEVAPEIGEFERTSTTVVNAFLQPVMHRYLGTLADSAQAGGLASDVLIVHGNGGAMTVDLATRFPVRTVMSGPAAGVLAARAIGSRIGMANLISCDMGGTSFDAALIIEGEVTQAAQQQIEFGVPIRTTMTEVLTIGAGGGSIAQIDRGGLLQVGPQSAGADPGPACYARGNLRATVTDANLVLGRINSKKPIGDLGIPELDVAASEKAIGELADQLALSVDETALAVLSVVENKMASALRLLTVERGRDPRDFALVMYGGGGPLHACALIRETGAQLALIPRHPGLLSAIGCVIADHKHDRVATVMHRLADLAAETLADEYAALVAAAHDDIAGFSSAHTRETVSYFGEAGYAGQVHVVSLAFGERPPSPADIRAAFDREYERSFGGLLPDLEVELRSVRVEVVSSRENARLAEAPLPAAPSGEPVRRRVRFEDGWFETPIVGREAVLAEGGITGPVIVEQDDTTLIVEPGFEITAAEDGTLLLRPRG